VPSILVTGAAGFIGFHLCKHLLARGEEVVGLDNLNEYYDVTLKQARLTELHQQDCFRFIKQDLADRKGMERVFATVQPALVVNLAAQAGVRYSLENPHAYIESNVVGFLNVLEGCRHQKVEHLVYASSSSVYGANTRMPFSVHHDVDHPLSLYAASKRSNELMAHTYSELYGLPTTGLRFFSVYGPWGRPDMALFLFTKSILEGRPIDVFNHGKMQRNFTYIDDVVEGVLRLLAIIPKPNADWSAETPDPSASRAPFQIYNIGNNQPVELLPFIRLIEECLGREAKLNMLPLQMGDVPVTFADIEALIQATGYKPSTPIEVGISRFVDWYRSYYKV
jgi:UDP-glucuronate 4-epimerase